MKISDVYKDVDAAKSRIENLRDEFKNSFGDSNNLRFFSCPGRSEIIGNHTDHQGGQVIACSIELDILACASPRGDKIVRIKSGEDLMELDLQNLEKQADEVGNSAGLIRGAAAGLAELGANLSGFDAVLDSTVPLGSGLSSSAAFSVLVGKIFATLSDFETNSTTLAKNAKFAENIYFEKPCGLMDQLATATGGMVYIDFEDAENPIIERLECDLKSANLNLVITNTGGSHADLTNAYAQIPADMKEVAAAMGNEILSECEEKDFYKKFLYPGRDAALISERAKNRAVHYFNECARVKLLKESIENSDFNEFLKIITESGLSSMNQLQNVYYAENDEQNLADGLKKSAKILKNKGAVRVHGGGFAGTILAFVPNEILQKYVAKMNKIFGESSAIISNIRDVGVCEIEV